MLVLGTHLFDLMRFFAGNPISCTARVQENGKDITAQNGRAATEQIGLIAGDDINAQFAFPNSVSGTFTSRGKLRGVIGHWGILAYRQQRLRPHPDDIFPNIFVSKTTPWDKNGREEKWQRLPGIQHLMLPKIKKRRLMANRRVVDDWIDAIQKDESRFAAGGRRRPRLRCDGGVSICDFRIVGRSFL